MEIIINVILIAFMVVSLIGGYQLLKDPYSKHKQKN